MARIVRMGVLVVLSLLLYTSNAAAHCDSMDGPVVKAAQRALAQGDVAHTLVWVKADHEQEIRKAFEQTVAVRKHGGVAAEMAERWFFETLVRVHRDGEGEPFTGLKPAGYYNDPAYVAADRALETGSFDLLAKIPEHVGAKLRQLHAQAVEARKFAPTDLAAGRKYVARYAEYVHYVEQIARLSHTDAAHQH